MNERNCGGRKGREREKSRVRAGREQSAASSRDECQRSAKNLSAQVNRARATRRGRARGPSRTSFPPGESYPHLLCSPLTLSSTCSASSCLCPLLPPFFPAGTNLISPAPAILIEPERFSRRILHRRGGYRLVTNPS